MSLAQCSTVIVAVIKRKTATMFEATTKITIMSTNKLCFQIINSLECNKLSKAQKTMSKFSYFMSGPRHFLL